MTPESQKAFNTFMGVLLLILSCVCFGLAGYLIFTPAQPTPAALPTVAAVSIQPCLAGLTALDFRATQNGDTVQVEENNANGPVLERLKAASLGISMCHLYLSEFCMGQICSNPNSISFKLSTNRAPAPAKMGQRK